MASDSDGVGAEPSHGGGTVAPVNPTQPQTPKDDLRSGYARDLAQVFNDEADSFERQGSFHPVLIFGTSQSGKSLALTSMLNYARQAENGRISSHLMDFNYPKSGPTPELLRQWAHELYHKDMSEYHSNPMAKMPRTQREYPFFVPVQVTFRPDGDGDASKKELARFAFLESDGEWFHKSANKYSFQDLRSEVRAVLDHFKGPLSAIFVAPAAADDLLDVDKVKKSHECLAHCMEQYIDARKRNPGDNVLFLVTKWDQLYPPDRSLRDDGVDNFANPSSQTVIEAVMRFGYSWPQFRELTPVPKDCKALAPYAATWIRDGIRTDEGQYKPVFDKFNKMLWNWLYGNVFSDIDRGNGSVKRKNFYPEVSPSTIGSRHLYGSLLRRVVSLVDR